MGKRKKTFGDDEFDSSASEQDFDDDGADGLDQDHIDEEQLFRDPASRARRHASKDEMIYGVFGYESDEDRSWKPRRGRKNEPVQFVASKSTTQPPGPSIGRSAPPSDARRGKDDMELDQPDTRSTDSGSDSGSDNDVGGSRIRRRARRPPHGNESISPSNSEHDDGHDDGHGDSDDEDDGDSDTGRRRPMVWNKDEESEEEEESRPSMSFHSSGLGFGRSSASAPAASNLDSMSDAMRNMQNIEFGSTRKPPKAPTQSKQPAPSSAPQASRQDIKKLESAYGIGFKLLSKQGYKVGQGLGMNSEGIAKPIDVKVLPKGAGLGRVDFQTETMKAEKRSKQQSDEAQDDDSAKATRDDKDAVSRSHDGWKRGSRRAKAQYKTAHEILLEQDGSPGDNAPSRPAAAPAVTKIIDMRGPEARVIVDASQIKSTSVPSVAATERIPELRYNMRLLVDLSQDQLMQLSKQLKLVKDARDQLQTKEARLKSVVAAEGSKIKRLEEVSKLAQDCQALSRQALVLVREGSDADPLKLFSPIFETLSSQYYEEYKAYNLDELVVASISPIIQAMTRMWSPLESPSTFVHHFKQWKQLLHTTSSSTPPQSQPKSRHLEADEIDHFGAATRFIQDSADSGNAKMTPYESLLYHIWLPKIRSAINNSWDVYEPEPLVQLLSAWCTGHYDQSASESDNGASATTIPRWLMDNIVDQLLMPKLSSAIDDWSPTKPSMHWWIHPWLPLLGDQLQPLLTPIRRRLEKSFGINSNGWHPSDPQGIANIKPWRGVLPDAEIDSMLVRAVLPKLIHTLRNELLVTPSEHQNMEPFAWVVAWHGTIPDALMARAFETEFFPKWLEALYRWLGHSTCDLEQVQQWYFAWKGSFPSTLLRHSGIEDSFKLALELISDQLDGSLSWKAVDAHLQRVLGEEPQPIPPVDTAAARRQRSAPDISFKEYAEKRAAENDLVFLPLHRKHESGKALFSLGPESAPRRLILFIDDGVVFVHEGGDLTSHSRWIPTSIDNAIDMASRQR